MIDEAPMEETESGRGPAGPGWFAVNVRDATWLTNEKWGDACVFETEAAEFEQIGYDLHILQPGQANGFYHREEDQEDFLVLSGECLLIVEGEERQLGPWDFVHCPPGTEHIFVGAGAGPCVIFMIGARAHRGRIMYTRSEVALRHGCGVETETSSAREAYREFPDYRPGRPASFEGLPFA
jgi:uncharacterized cupin superfamily protein